MNRFLAMAGLGSRRSMDDVIAAGRVTVNGATVTALGVQVLPGKDVVTVDGRTVELFERDVYILLNKPKNCITTLSDERDRTTILDYVHVKPRVFPVGRLDRNTTGVLLLTNDGMLANALLHPRGSVERTYRALLSEPLRSKDLEAIRKGVRLSDGVARVREIAMVERRKVLLTLAEGRNREVRRLFEAKGYEVKQLDRVAYAGLTASGLKRGAWRFLSRAEVNHLRKLVGHPSATGKKRTTRRRRTSR